MEFRLFKTAVQRQFNAMKGEPLFRVNADSDEMWKLYLESFPEGTNPMFRQRREYDCSCCRHFIRDVGDMVVIRNGEMISIWDIQVNEPAYQAVAIALAKYVRSRPIDNIYVFRQIDVGVDKNHEDVEGRVLTWEHFHVELPKTVVGRPLDTNRLLSDSRASHDVLLRSLREITVDAIETVQDLIGQNSLLRGAEKKAIVDTFAKMKKRFDAIKDVKAQDLYVWSCIRDLNTAFVSKIRNDVIGTLLVDLSENVDLEAAVKSFEDKVSGTNYKRPTALITPKMRDAARQYLIDKGLMGALERRFATLEDITINNVLFANPDARKRLRGDVFSDLPVRGVSKKSMDKADEVSIADFIANILPKATSIDVLFDNQHISNLVSMTAPCDLTAPSMFKWPNPFAWSYHGDVADSIKERVKRAGGAVTGDVCCRLVWDNTDDLDFHMDEPGFHLFFPNRRQTSPNGGVLDVDANGADGLREDPCENIVYANWKKMKHGKYELYVNQYNRRQGINPGFEVELDVMGTVHHFSYPKAMKNMENVGVATLVVSAEGVQVIPKLESSTMTKTVWNLQTKLFHPVQAMMLSPNYWDGKEIGNKHYFFMLDGCKNDGSARGFYNEFLSSGFEAHRKSMEMVGSRMRTEESDNQLSGLGFSSTQRNSVMCRVSGAFTRTIKVVF